MRKHLLYLTNTELTARISNGSKLSDGHRFNNDEIGWHLLEVYLSQHVDVPVFLLMDIIEEDFHRDTIPHIIGATRGRMIERRLAQLYHETPFRHASFLGREKTDRKDDIMLFNALTNAPLINTWLDIILRHNIPVAGIFSTALLSPLLFHKLQAGKDATLFITHQSAGLRQSFFHDGHLRFSRLIKLTTQDADSVADTIRSEITKAQQFLVNAKFLQRQELLNIVVVDNTATLQSLQKGPVGSGTSSFQSITLQEAENRLQKKVFCENGLADNLYLSILAASSAPAPHYELQNKNYAYLMFRLRTILYAMSAGALICSLLWSATSTMAAIDAVSTQERLAQSSKKYEQRYQQIVRSFPKTIGNPADMKSAVEMHAMVIKSASTPNRAFGIISQSLNRMPQLKINELDWQIDDGKDVQNSVPGAEPPAPTAATAGPISTSIVGIATPSAEVMIIKGEIAPFNNNYRSAVDAVKQFAKDLAKNKNVQVSITSLPLDIRSTVTLKGEAGNVNDTARANFELKMVLANN